MPFSHDAPKDSFHPGHGRLRVGRAAPELYQGRPEMAVTQSAVCRQVAALEEFLGLSCFAAPSAACA
jgi:hypothetical protein